MAEPVVLASRAAGPSSDGPIELVGRSPAVERVRELVRRAATLSSGVLLVGERGIDVEAVAGELHARGRPAGPFVVFSCAVGDNARLEEHLFGRPAASTSLELVSPDSRLTAASGGTLCLLDIIDLPSGLQARLARVLRDGEVELDGKVVRHGVRVVASATAAIDNEVRDRQFRDDLYRRLTGSRIDLPPLRERRDDIPAVAALVLDEICRSRRLPPYQLADAAHALLAAVTWPGNLAELRTVLERAVEAARDEVILIEQVLPALSLNRAAPPFSPRGTLREARVRFERDYILSVLQHHGWRMAAAARTLGMQRPNLYRKARQLGIPVARLSD